MPFNNFQIEALPRQLFEPLFGIDDVELSQHHARWIIADADTGFPCRVSLQDARTGERLLAVSHLFHDRASPYRAAGPIFVREASKTALPATGEIPAMFHGRLLSLRAYKADGSMISADVVRGNELESGIEQQLQIAEVEFIHIHNARQGCFLCSVTPVAP